MTKWTYFMFSTTDYRAIEEYLEEMALKGWMIQKFRPPFLKFKKIEPANIKFTVDIFPTISILDPENKEEIVDYRHLCEESGWTFIDGSKQFQLFYTKEDNLIPIQTDEIIRQKVIKKAVFSAEILPFLILIPVLLMQLWDVFNFHYTRLFSNSSLIATITPIFLLLIIGIQALPGVLWVWRGKRSLQRGEEILPSTLKTAKRRNLFFGIIFGTYTLMLGSLFILEFFYDSSVLKLVGVIILFTLGSFGVALIYRRIVNRFKWSRGKNAALLAGIFVLYFIIGMNLILFTVLDIVGETTEKKQNTKDITLLSLADFGIKDKIETNDYFSQSSIFVPINIDYDEMSKNEGIRTVYLKAASSRISDYIVNEMIVGDNEQNFRKQEIDSITYYLSEDNNNLLIQKGKIIVRVYGDIDFSNKDNLQTCIKKLNL